MSRSILLVALTLTVACRASAPSVQPRPPGAPGTSGDIRPSRAVRWVRDSAEHRALLLQVFRAATAHVDRAAAGREPGTWAVVSDVDETLLDNSLYQVEREREGLGFSAESWDAWTARRESVPLPGATAFLSRVRSLGGRIAVVTNRRVSQCPDTEAVFRRYGLAYDVMLCRGDESPADKEPRFDAVADGSTPADLPPLEIVAFLGDNIRDFPGQSQALRDAEEADLATFGTRFFVLPNPMYGSWEQARRSVHDENSGPS
jgi:5'-nucleotidase (lipoprotein e(P4) family)